MDDPHSRAAVQHRLISCQRCGHHAGPRCLDRLDGHSRGISRSPAVGRRLGPSIGDADLRAGLCLLLPIGIRRSRRASLAASGRSPGQNLFSPQLLGRDARHGVGYVSLRLSPEPERPPQYERLVRRGGAGERRLPSLDPLACDAAADAPFDCCRGRPRHLVRRVGLRCGLLASLPDPHLCRVSADDRTIRQYRSEHLEPLTGRTRADFPGHRTVVPATKPVLPNHRPLPGSAAAPLWLARQRRSHRLSRTDRRRGLRTPGLAIDSMEPVARGTSDSRQPVLRVRA